MRAGPRAYLSPPVDKFRRLPSAKEQTLQQTASPIDNLLTAQEQLAKRSTNATGHLLAMFEKPTVAFEAQNFCVKSPTIQVEFEIKRSSTTTLSAVASASINFR